MQQLFVDMLMQAQVVKLVAAKEPGHLPRGAISEDLTRSKQNRIAANGLLSNIFQALEVFWLSPSNH
jgi:hypothetical protein